MLHYAQQEHRKAFSLFADKVVETKENFYVILESEENIEAKYSVLCDNLKNLDMFSLLFRVILEKFDQPHTLHWFYQRQKIYLTTINSPETTDVDISLKNSLDPDTFAKFYNEKEEGCMDKLKTCWIRYTETKFGDGVHLIAGR
jgi:hypothetical protein